MKNNKSNNYFDLSIPVRSLLILGLFLELCICGCLLPGVFRQKKIAPKMLLLSGMLLSGVFMIIYTAEARARLRDLVVPEISEWLCKQPILLPLFVFLLVLANTVWFAIKEYRFRKNTITRSSIKEGVDKLNSGLCFYFPPYEIAPYTSGVVVAEIPYEKLTGILKDDYFPAERQEALGNVTAEPMTQAGLDKFTQFSEITLQPGSDTFLLSTDHAVYNLTMQTAVVQSGVVNPLHTVFAAASLTPGDAIMVQGEPSLDSEFLILSYETGGTPIRMYLYKDDAGAVNVFNTIK